jgi:hypothetical protein
MIRYVDASVVSTPAGLTEEYQFSRLEHDSATAKSARHFTLWLSKRLKNPAPVLSSEFGVYAGWCKIHHVEPVNSPQFWYVLSDLLGPTIRIRIRGRVERAHVPPPWERVPRNCTGEET